MPQQRIELIEEQVDGPEVRALVRQPGGVAIAELVVVDHGPAIERGDILEGIDIVMRAAWPAMRDDQRQLAANPALPVMRYQVR